MVYRAAPDNQRVTALEALIAQEPALVQDRARARFAQHELIERVDQLGVAAEDARQAIERPGPLARVRGWFGGGAAGRARALAALDAAHADATRQLEAQRADEHALDARLAAIGEARVELAALEAAQGALLVSAPGPAGDEYRAIAAAIAPLTTAAELLHQALGACERAEVAVRAVRDHDDELRVARNTRRNLTQVLIDAATTSPSMILQARIHDAVVDARAHLHHLATALVDLHELWPPDVQPPTDRLFAIADAAVADPPERSALVIAARELTGVVDRTMSRLQQARAANEQRHQAQLARQRAVAARALRGA